MPKKITITKANGEQAKFDPQKVIDSLKRSGANNPEIKQVLKEVYPKLRNGMTTKEVYHYVYAALDSIEGRGTYIASRYSLKRAISELGPTGFPFEQFVAGVLKELGYEIQTNLMIEGDCIKHEIDVKAIKGEEVNLVEVKFHKKMGYKTDVKTALYVYARFLDLQKQFTKPWIVTNTKVTSEVKKYAMCRDIKVTSWDYPRGESLREMVDRAHLHPITSLGNVDNLTKETLLANNIIFIKDIHKAEFIFPSQKKYQQLCQIADEFSKTHPH